ncbi:hypothetical protein DFJ74DRAFT_424430 [Hyaloraphidium curvatum]|nr:hypothetical protein DFJ74DRAFT_424430 [Hyaloraphidium curvatum]
MQYRVVLPPLSLGDGDSSGAGSPVPVAEGPVEQLSKWDPPPADSGPQRKRFRAEIGEDLRAILTDLPPEELGAEVSAKRPRFPEQEPPASSHHASGSGRPRAKERTGAPLPPFSKEPFKRNTAELSGARIFVGNDVLPSFPSSWGDNAAGSTVAPSAAKAAGAGPFILVQSSQQDGSPAKPSVALPIDEDSDGDDAAERSAELDEGLRRAAADNIFLALSQFEASQVAMSQVAAEKPGWEANGYVPSSVPGPGAAEDDTAFALTFAPVSQEARNQSLGKSLLSRDTNTVESSPPASPKRIPVTSIARTAAATRTPQADAKRTEAPPDFPPRLSADDIVDSGPSEDEIIAPVEFPRHGTRRHTFASPEPLRTLRPDERELWCFVCVVMQINTLETWHRPDGSEVHFRSIGVGDPDVSFFGLTLWGGRVNWVADRGQADRFEIGDVIAVEGMKIRSFRKKGKDVMSASTTGAASAAKLLFRYSSKRGSYVRVPATLPSHLATRAAAVVAWAASDTFLSAHRSAVKNSEQMMSKPLQRVGQALGRDTIEDVLAGLSTQLRCFVLGIHRKGHGESAGVLPSPSLPGQKGTDIVLEVVDSRGKRAKIICPAAVSTLANQARSLVDRVVDLYGVDLPSWTLPGRRTSRHDPGPTFAVSEASRIDAIDGAIAADFRSRVDPAEHARVVEDFSELTATKHSGLAVINGILEDVKFSRSNAVICAKGFENALEELESRIEDLPAPWCTRCQRGIKLAKDGIARCTNHPISEQAVEWSFAPLYLVISGRAPKPRPRTSLESQFAAPGASIRASFPHSMQSNASLMDSLFGSVRSANSPQFAIPLDDRQRLSLQVSGAEAAASLFPGLPPQDLKQTGGSFAKAKAALWTRLAELVNTKGQAPERRFLVSVAVEEDDAGYVKTQRAILKRLLD